MSFYTIPANQPFAKTVAETAIDLAERHNIPLSSIKIFLPTRRGIRTLQNAFLSLSNGKACILPIMQSIGDADIEEIHFTTFSHTDTILPAIDPLQRQIILARLLERAWKDDYNYQQAIALAADLGRLIDQIHTEGINTDNLYDIILEKEFSEYWNLTASFLSLVLNELWPAYLKEKKMIDPGLHRRLTIEKITQYYTDNKPNNPIIIAGSTGSIPATRNFIKAIAQHPENMVILPSLDTVMDERSWYNINDGHPQYLIKRLLKHCDIFRKNVISIGETNDRFYTISEIMRPSETTDEWQQLIDTHHQTTIQNGLNNLTLCETENDYHESVTIALSMLEIAADPHQTKTATLITPNRKLAMRVQSVLRQWGINIDDSGGTSLTNTSIGKFCLSIAHSYQNNQINPIPLLSALKNELAGGGEDTMHLRTYVRSLEKELFRGVRPYGDFRSLEQLSDNNKNFINTLLRIFSPFDAYQTGKHSFLSILNAHIKIMEDLASTSDLDGASRLWVGDAGELLAEFFAKMQIHGTHIPPLTLGDYNDLMSSMLTTQSYTSKYGKHPRLNILGQIEARMVSSDRIILGGLNEGVWPPDSGFDTWMSRKMRADFGLPSLEQKTTLAAHDFSCAFCSPEVFITRSKKSDGQPTLPSRWIERLNTVMIAANINSDNHPSRKGQPYLYFAHSLRKTNESHTIERPKIIPRPEHRPTKFSITDIEKWMRDPYWIYAKKILQLRKMDPVDMNLSVADRGTLIHEALEIFTKNHPTKQLPSNAHETLINIGADIFDKHEKNPEIHGFWWPRFVKAAQQFIEHEQEWRKNTVEIYSELSGEIYFDIHDKSICLSGKADRIEKRNDNVIAIIDYKTGNPPLPGDVNNGIASQLPLEALLIKNNAFPHIHFNNESSYDFQYWNLSGTETEGISTAAQGTRHPLSSECLINNAMTGITSLFAKFMLDDCPYIGSPDTTKLIAYNDYAHLERIAEWSVMAEGEDT